jgi:MFS family permease
VISAAINTHALVKMAYSSVLAGVGVAVVFSIAILGMARSSEMRREHRTGAAAAYTALAATGLLLAAGIVIYGLILVAHKT